VQGPAGPPGPTGLAAIHQVEGSAHAGFETVKQSQAICPLGEVALGGGYEAEKTDGFGGIAVVYVVRSQPVRNQVSGLHYWAVTAFTPEAFHWTLRAYVICAPSS
jgi:hypothetical protein